MSETNHPAPCLTGEEREVRLVAELIMRNPPAEYAAARLERDLRARAADDNMGIEEWRDLAVYAFAPDRGWLRDRLRTLGGVLMLEDASGRVARCLRLISHMDLPYSDVG